MHINDIVALPDLQAVKKRFEAKFARRGIDDCWEWTAGKDSKGYGGFNICHTAFAAHRVSFVLYKGPLEDNGSYHGSCVCHRCDNPGCVNPSHLFKGTVLDNARDSSKKDRVLHGVRNNAVKLTPEQVRAIRQCTGSVEKLANSFGIHKTTAYRIRRGDSWWRLK